MSECQELQQAREELHQAAHALAEAFGALWCCASCMAWTRQDRCPGCGREDSRANLNEWIKKRDREQQ